MPKKKAKKIILHADEKTTVDCIIDNKGQVESWGFVKDFNSNRKRETDIASGIRDAIAY